MDRDQLKYEMNAIHSSSYFERHRMGVPISNECDSTNYTNITHSVKVFEYLQSLREDEVLCDIRLKADDDTIVLGHKVVLMSASEYFMAMFTNFSEQNKDIVGIREVDSTALKQLVDYIYSGKIMISKENVQVLLSAADMLQLDFVKGACAEFLQRQLGPTNCLGIRSLADLYSCFELLSSSEAYIRKEFLDVVKGDEFLSLSTEVLVKLISGNVLNAPEEKVYECVINWVKHELNVRYDSLPKLMEHVRLPLASLEYISINVAKEPLLKNIPKSKDYLMEAFKFHEFDTQQHGDGQNQRRRRRRRKTKQLTTSQAIRNTPRMSGQKVILLWDFSCRFLLYDPTTNFCQYLPKSSLKDCYCVHKLTLIIKQLALIQGESFKQLGSSLKFQSWVTSLDGGTDNLNGDEIFDICYQEWRMISSMFSKRTCFGVGVLNNLFYVVGGHSTHSSITPLKSVECYDPSLDTWKPVAEMSSGRYKLAVGVMNGLIYAVGGANEYGSLKSVEAYNPSSGKWTSISDMHLARSGSRVFTLNGLLYVVGGHYGANVSERALNRNLRYESNEYIDENARLNSIEVYDPTTNTWSMEKILENLRYTIDGVVIVDKAIVTKFHN